MDELETTVGISEYDLWVAYSTGAALCQIAHSENPLLAPLFGSLPPEYKAEIVANLLAEASGTVPSPTSEEINRVMMRVHDFMEEFRHGSE